MENKYTIKTAFKMGEPHDTYGQTWYTTVEEMQYPVMFNLMGESTVQEGDRVTYEEMTVEHFKSGKNAGKEYRRIKKVKVEEGAPRIVEAPSTANTSELEARVKALEDKVFGNGTNPLTPAQDTVVTEIDDSFDMSQIPF